jgi:sugar/nucleoside kinase (ribokinase family)
VVTRYLVVGDAVLDVTVAPSRPVRRGGDVTAVMRLGPGGQGANVAVRLARRGAEVTLAAPIADDAGGRLLHEGLTGEGVGLAPLPATRTAVVVALLDPGGERSMLSDRQTLDPDAVSRTLAGADWVHVSAYALIDDRDGDALGHALGARPAGRLSVAGGSIAPEPALVGRFLRRLADSRPDMLVVSREEATALLGGAPQLARAAAAALADRAELVVVTAGIAGSAASLGGRVVEAAAPELPGPTVDATGAGDAYVAALIARLADAPWPPGEDVLRKGMDEGSHAGALVARVVGAQAPVEGESTVAARGRS